MISRTRADLEKRHSTAVKKHWFWGEFHKYRRQLLEVAAGSLVANLLAVSVGNLFLAALVPGLWIAAPVAADDPRVIRMRTFSKGYGMAGARIGYAIADAPLITAFNKIRNHFGVSRIAQAGALAALADPVGEVLDGWVRPNGLAISRVRVPLGVVAIIYENRPNVTSDAAGLCLKSGNAAFLRGSSGAITSNIAIAAVLREADDCGSARACGSEPAARL